MHHFHLFRPHDWVSGSIFESTGQPIVTSLHRKSTTTNSLLYYDSFHPLHIKKTIPTGQFLCLRRNCTEVIQFNQHARELTGHFQNRNYSHLSQNVYQRAKRSHREDVLGHTSIRPKDVPALTANRALNLRDDLTRSHFTRPTRQLASGQKLKGSYACCECNICQFMLPFMHPTNGRSYNLCNSINYKSKNMIYCMICSCSKIYVGQTGNELRKRIQKHLSTIALAKRYSRYSKKLTAIAEHFLKYHKSNTRGLKGVDVGPRKNFLRHLRWWFLSTPT